ncbi:hypothetical protein VL14_13080 [Cytobacillus firmus]|nr:hypothetical protein VL14_13080 [Cytobacillus firmus]
MLVVPGQSPQHFFQSDQKVKEQPFSRLVLCLRPAGQVRLRQHKHRTTESDSFWEDAGHADVATGQGKLRQQYIARPKAVAFGRTWRF